MKHTSLLLILALLLSGCSSSAELGGAFAGSSLGGMFGSSIGGLLGGPRGHDKGTVIGMVAGAAVGAAAVSATQEKAKRRTSHQDANADCGVAYGDYNDSRYVPPASPWDYLEVTGVTFADANGNHCLDAGETAYLTMDIYNRGDRPIANVAPLISCSDRRVAISPAAIIAAIPPGQGVRYKAALQASKSLRQGTATFSVSFGSAKGRQGVVAKTFKIRTARR